MNIRTKVTGVPIFLWVTIVLLVAIVAGAVVLSNVLQTTTHVSPPPTADPVQLSWFLGGAGLPAEITIGQDVTWIMQYTNTAPSTSYSGKLVVSIASSGATLNDPTIVIVEISILSPLWADQTISVSVTADGHLEGRTTPATIAAGSQGTLYGSVRFNNNAPTTSYTFQFWVEQA